MRTQAWRADAACRDTDPDVFYPVASTGPDVDVPKGICAGCPVRLDCLDWAMANREEHGVWGGLTEQERRRIRRRANRRVAG